MKKYYYIDINTKTLKIVGWGVSDTANHSGDTDNEDIHRMFMASAGQYNKLVSKFEKAEQD